MPQKPLASSAPLRPPLGAQVQGGGTKFSVWAPAAKNVSLELRASDGTALTSHALQPQADGVFSLWVPGVGAGALYRFSLDGGAGLPDPRSRWQPQGVFGDSCVVDLQRFAWTDAAWGGRAPADWVIYELHVGTFTAAGTFDAVRHRLDALQELGVNALELMPVHAFAGHHNWGYDPGALYAPAHSYGSPQALAALVDAAHARGMAMVLDVVYNHLGPAGAFAPAYCPFFFTERHHTSWGAAINLDGARAAPIRQFFFDNALSWLRDYHFDALRLDATAALVDDSPTHFLAELSDQVGRLTGPRRLLFAEDSRNLLRLLRPTADGGYGMDALWVDDFHHQLHTTLTGEQDSYYRDYPPGGADLARTLQRHWLYCGQRSAHLQAPRGTQPVGVQPQQAIFCLQNHDQVGNRARGDRLHHTVAPQAYRAASALLLLAPQVPLLFAGQEWGARTPFQFFTDHEAELGKQVSAGRRAEFAGFSAFYGAIPDPQNPQTFADSVLNWEELQTFEAAALRCLYRELLHLRQSMVGAVQVLSWGPGHVLLQRQGTVLLVTLLPAQQVVLPAWLRAQPLVWHTEAPAFTRTGVPPVLLGDSVRCHHEIAVLWRHTCRVTPQESST
jgi:maltooligosyltrehalose trehalohydrolase